VQLGLVCIFQCLVQAGTGTGSYTCTESYIDSFETSDRDIEIIEIDEN
jgi:hypothetical protein